MSYSVVHFFLDDSVEAVPSFWFKGKTCAWPKNNIYAKKYIETKRAPNDTDFIFLKARELCKGLSKFIVKIFYINCLFYFINIHVFNIKKRP